MEETFEDAIRHILHEREGWPAEDILVSLSKDPVKTYLVTVADRDSPEVVTALINAEVWVMVGSGDAVFVVDPKHEQSDISELETELRDIIHNTHHTAVLPGEACLRIGDRMVSGSEQFVASMAGIIISAGGDQS